MAKFDIVKNGYDTKQVDDYLYKITEDSEDKLHNQLIRINDLKREVESYKTELENYKKKNDSISDALLVAVETAKQIEGNSEHIYQLEIERIRSLYDKWKKILDDLVKIHPTLKDKYDTTELLKVFSNDIDKILKQNKKSIEQKQVVAVENFETSIPNTIGIRLLINKMHGKTQNDLNSLTENNAILHRQKPSNETLSKYKAEQNQKESTNKLVKDQIKSISNLTIDKDEKFENVVDKFLMSDEDDYESSAYSKILLEKQKNDKFDLKEAITPTEDLEEIMKSFSFYPENEEQKMKKGNK